MKIKRFNEINESLELDELYKTKRDLEERKDNYFGDGIEHTGDQGYQDLLQDLDEIDEEIEKLESGTESTNENLKLSSQQTIKYYLDILSKHGISCKVNFRNMYGEVIIDGEKKFDTNGPASRQVIIGYVVGMVEGLKQK